MAGDIGPEEFGPDALGQEEFRLLLESEGRAAARVLGAQGRKVFVAIVAIDTRVALLKSVVSQSFMVDDANIVRELLEQECDRLARAAAEAKGG